MTSLISENGFLLLQLSWYADTARSDVDTDYNIDLFPYRCFISGPSKWSKTYPIAVSGTKQSPIDIRTDACSCRETSKALVIQYPDAIPAATLKNSGYGWVVNIPKDQASKAWLTGGPLDDWYRLEQFHAHWGADCDCGSEHTVNGHSYAAEVSMSHELQPVYLMYLLATAAPRPLEQQGLFIFWRSCFTSKGPCSAGCLLRS